MTLDRVRACYSITGEVSGMLIAIELNMILYGSLLCTVDKRHRITLE